MDAHGNLTGELTGFVGRRAELTLVRQSLSAARLVTLTGAGGIGKTRLALRAASAARRAFRDGVWLTELAGLRDPALLAAELARSHAGARVAALAGASEVLVTSTVQMLVLGSGITFADRGEHTLRGARVRIESSVTRLCSRPNGSGSPTTWPMARRPAS